MTPLEDHPIAALFPLLPDAELDALAEDIGERGLLSPILVHEGKILDGRNRYRACLKAGVEPETAIYTGTDPIKDTLSLNLHRRHLSESQRAMIAAQLASLPVGANQHAEGAQIQAPSQASAAEMLSVSRSSVQSAKRVRDASPELAAQVTNGSLTVHAAERHLTAQRHATTPRQPDGPPSEGMAIARKAIDLLRKIQRDDTQRLLAGAEVISWVQANLT
jgi:ParB-like chromosome segregation protein Spo0J